MKNMEYPGSYLTRPWRLFILVVFVLAFLIISPILVLYTSGYRYDFVNGIIRETGALSIDILPKNTTVHLNNTNLNSKIPIRLKNLISGKYKVKLTADGYYDWEKEIVVENKQTTYIKEIKLTKKSEPQKISNNKIKKTYLSANADFIVYETDTTTSTFWLLDLKNNIEKEIVKGQSGKKYHVNWSNSRNNFFSIASEDLSEIYIINAAETNNIWNLKNDEKNEITKIQWNDSAQPEIIYTTKDELIKIDAFTKQKATIGANVFMDWHVDKNQIWTLQISSSTNQIYVVKDTFGFTKILTKIDVLTIINSSSPPWKIIKAENSRVLLKKPNGLEMTLVEENKHFNFFGDQSLASDYNNWWITWTPWEITTHSQNQEPFLLYRSGEQLQKIIVLDEFNTLGLVWENKMTVLFPYYYVSHDLINKKINDAVADISKRELYFSANIDNQDGLWKIQY